MSTPEVISTSVAVVAVTAAIISTVRLFLKTSTSGPIAVKRKGSDKVVILPEHYSAEAVRNLLEVLK